MIPVIAGIAIGIGLALMITRFLSSLLFSIRSTDPLTYVCVAIFALVTGLLACYLPTARATRIDPATALRVD